MTAVGSSSNSSRAEFWLEKLLGFEVEFRVRGRLGEEFQRRDGETTPPEVIQETLAQAEVGDGNQGEFEESQLTVDPVLPEQKEVQIRKEFGSGLRSYYFIWIFFNKYSKPRPVSTLFVATNEDFRSRYGIKNMSEKLLRGKIFNHKFFFLFFRFCLSFFFFFRFFACLNFYTISERDLYH